MNYKLSILYFAAVVIANLGFTYLPMISLPGGQSLAPMSFLVGFIFVLRDYAQRELGHRVLAVMAAGVAVSYFLADPFVAAASAFAFAISEFADWLVYTYTKKSMRQRVLISSAISTPVDSSVFMLMLGFFSLPGLLIMTASKMIGALAVWYWAGRG
jgi:uncharacterized PurR-regulated membrane protein YhhQ (DUF165 family)